MSFKKETSIAGFTGTTRGGKQHGQGKQEFDNGDVYEGDWFDGKPHGYGTFSYGNKAQYVGDFRNGARHGQGTYKFANGNVYSGEWNAGKRSGKGKYKSADGNAYEGNFENNAFHGQGALHYSNGDFFQGDFINGQRHGEGTLTMKSKDKYTGSWVNNCAHGVGTMYQLSLNMSFIGRFERGKMIAQMCSNCSHLPDELVECVPFDTKMMCSKCSSLSVRCPTLAQGRHSKEELQAIAKERIQQVRWGFGMTIAEETKAVKAAHAVRVLNVLPRSTAEVAGLQRGDTLVRVNTRPVTDKAAALKHLQEAARPSGAPVALEFKHRHSDKLETAKMDVGCALSRDELAWLQLAVKDPSAAINGSTLDEAIAKLKRLVCDAKPLALN